MKRKPNKSLKIVSLPEDNNKINIFNRNFVYLKPKDIKRSYTRLIQDFCAGKVTGEDARTISYLFAGYLQVIRDYDFELRIAELEERISQNEK
jgi:hypothetical protein